MTPTGTPRTAFVPLRFDERSTVFQGGVVLAGSLFLAVCSWISVPMIPVPVTMQTFGVLFLGALCGWRLGLGATLAYLAEGAMGLPVFAGGAGGIHHLLGPTAGYLIAFPLAAALAGTLAERGWTLGLARSFAVMMLGHAVILALGTAVLAGKIGAEKAIAFGLVPFIVGTILKSALGAALVTVARRRA